MFKFIPYAVEKADKKILFELKARDNNSFSIFINKDLDNNTRARLEDKIYYIPGRKYDVTLRVSYFHASVEAIEYLRKTFKEDEYLIEETVRQYFSCYEDIMKILQTRLKKRLKYDKNYPDVDIDLGVKPGIVALKHQKYCVNEIKDMPFFALLCEMGTGKTFISLHELFLACRKNRGKTVKALIVAPNTICLNWIKELNKFQPYDIACSSVRLRRAGDKDFINDIIRVIKEPTQLKLVVINYERLDNPAIAEIIKMLNFDYIYLDESTYIKNPSAKRTKAVLTDTFTSIPKRRILTGTVNPNNCLDLFTQYEFLAPGLGILGAHTFNEFREKYAIVDSRYGSYVSGINMDKLQEKMALCSIVIKKKDCLDLPESTYVQHIVPMKPKHRVIYEKMVNEFLVEFGDDLSDKVGAEAQYIIVQLMRLAQIANGFLPVKKLLGEVSVDFFKQTIQEIPDGDCKAEKLAELIDQIDYDSKFIIWHRFKEDAKKIRKILEEKNISYGLLSGEVPEKERSKTIDSFNSEEGIRVIVGQPQTGGVGITLLGTENKPCANVIRYSADFSFFNREQSESRCHRIGMFTPVTYHDILAENSIDEFMLERVLTKKDNAESLKDFTNLRQKLLGELL